MSIIKVNTRSKILSAAHSNIWVRPADYQNRDLFNTACIKAHWDENNPELIFENWISVPQRYISKTRISDELWDWLKLTNPLERFVCTLYWDNVCCDRDIPSIMSSYMGFFEHRESWGIWNLCGKEDKLRILPKSRPRPNYDFKKYAMLCEDVGAVIFVKTQTFVHAFSGDEKYSPHCQLPLDISNFYA